VISVCVCHGGALVSDTESFGSSRVLLREVIAADRQDRFAGKIPKTRVNSSGEPIYVSDLQCANSRSANRSVVAALSFTWTGSRLLNVPEFSSSKRTSVAHIK